MATHINMGTFNSCEHLFWYFSFRATCYASYLKKLIAYTKHINIGTVLTYIYK